MLKTASLVILKSMNTGNRLFRVYPNYLIKIQKPFKTYLSIIIMLSSFYMTRHLQSNTFSN